MSLGLVQTEEIFTEQEVQRLKSWGQKQSYGLDIIFLRFLFELSFPSSYSQSIQETRII